MLYWDETHKPKALVLRSSYGHFPVFSCIKIRYFLEEYFGISLVNRLEDNLGYFMIDDVKITRDVIYFTFDDLMCIRGRDFNGAEIRYYACNIGRKLL